MRLNSWLLGLFCWGKLGKNEVCLMTFIEKRALCACFESPVFYLYEPAFSPPKIFAKYLFYSKKTVYFVAVNR
jgi:hypothetical protein